MCPHVGYSRVFLSLRGVEIANNSYIYVDDIGGLRGATTEGLLCHTDAYNHGGRLSHAAWYFPNGSVVWHYTQFSSRYGSVPAHSFEINSGYGLVRLFTRGNPSERGLFHCIIADANGFNKTLFVTIGKYIGYLMMIIQFNYVTCYTS